MFSAITMNKRQLLLLCICVVLIAFLGTITVKLLPVYAVYLGADPATTGLFLAFAFLNLTVGTITGGWLSDRIGIRKPILFLSCAVWIPIGIFLIQVSDMPRLILTTGLFWLPGGIALSMVNTLTALSAGEGERGKVFGLTAMAAGTGGLLAGAIGGPIAERWGFPILFMVMVAVIVLFLLFGTALHDERTPRPETRSRIQNSSPVEKRVGVGGLLWLLLVSTLLVRLGQFIGGLGSPLTMVRVGFDAAAVSSAIAVSAAVTLPLPLVLGWLADRVGRKRCLVLCYGVGALGLFLLVQALSLWQFWLAASLLAIAERSTGVAQALAADLTPAHAMGRGMSLFHSSSAFAGILGMGGAGFIMQTIGISPTILLGAFLVLIGIGFIYSIRQPALVLSALHSAEVKT